MKSPIKKLGIILVGTLVTFVINSNPANAFTRNILQSVGVNQIRFKARNVTSQNDVEQIINTNSAGDFPVLTFNPIDNRDVYFYNLAFGLNRNVNLSETKRFRISYSIVVDSTHNIYSSEYPMFVCPSAEPNFVVDSCDVYPVSPVNDGYIVPADNTGTSNISHYGANYVYLYVIDGHFNSTSDYNTNLISFTGNFLTYHNGNLPSFSSQNPFNIQFSFGFFETYEEIVDGSVVGAINSQSQQQHQDSQAEINSQNETTEAIEEQNEKDEQDRDNIESQSSSAENEADSAGDAAEDTGTSLFSAFSQLLTALTSVNGNSCVLPRMQVYSLDFGQMNLCQFDIPPQIMALVSIGMVFIIVPLGINLVKRMISLYKEITG